MKRLFLFARIYKCFEIAERKAIKSVNCHERTTTKFMERLSFTPFLEIRQKFILNKVVNSFRNDLLISFFHATLYNNVKIWLNEKLLFHNWLKLKVSSFWDSSVWRCKHPETSGRNSSGLGVLVMSSIYIHYAHTR